MKLKALLLIILAGCFTHVTFAGTTEQFTFRQPHPLRFEIEIPSVPAQPSQAPEQQWLRATPLNGSTNFVEFSSRIVVQTKPGVDLQTAIQGGASLKLAREVIPGVAIFQASDALTAMREADRLAKLPGITAAYPVMREQGELHGQYAPQPKDSLFSEQWYLEDRNANGSKAGVDINVRAAWPFTLGQGITVAVVDTGIEFAHYELAPRLAGSPHFNFAAQTTNAGPIDDFGTGAHGTEVSGLIAASQNDYRMTGVAPSARLASWVIFFTNGNIASDEHLMDMYQYQSNVVSVQNHSWGHPGRVLSPVPLLQQIGISNAVTYGRGGLGSIICRSAGNNRSLLVDANDDGYPSDPQVIAVGAVRQDGRIASYTQPGACVLVGAPSGDFNAGFAGLFSTDLLGTRGADQINYFPPYQDLSDYVFDSLAFSGTSASTPLISGIAALMLSTNPNLTYRDVQQILALSSRHYDFADPDVSTNGAGFAVSHSIGFGIPDAGQALKLGLHWTNRPATTNISLTANTRAVIPDEGLKLVLTRTGIPDLGPLHILPTTGLHVENATASLPLVDFGYGTNAAGFNLTNKAALIQRDANTFTPKLALAAQAGAAFAIVYNFSTNNVANPPGGDFLVVMSTDFGSIPAVFLGHNDGEALKGVFATNDTARVQIRLQSTNYQFTVTNTLLCEHVGLRVQTDHQRRGDLRITLVSPSGTRSVLQHYSFDTAPGPVDWTYYTTHNFFESSAGTWTAYVSDEGAGYTGSVLSMSLQIQGVPIADTDHDGLDDNWELERFGSLAQGPKDDPDRDGYNNMREQLLGTNPVAMNDLPVVVDLSRWSSTISRLSWPGDPNTQYQIWSGTSPDSLQPTVSIPGTFPETEWFVTNNIQARQFFRVQAMPPP